MIKDLMRFGRVEENVALKDYNTYKIGGTARYISFPENVDSLQELITYLKTNNVKYKIFGNGSNMIVGDNLYDGVIIKLSKLDSINIDSDSNEVYAESGVMLPILAMKCVNAGFAGIEWAAGIPGTVGGSIIGNAGSYNVELYDCLKNITLINEAGILETVDVKNVKHAYRYSEFKERDVTIIGGTFKLVPANREELLELIESRKEKRKETQPLEYPSAGSVFRNPTDENLANAYKNFDLKGPFAGHLIEKCGLKGKSINGAEISEKHANFIINKGNATAADIKELIDLMKNTVKDKFDCELKAEQEFFNWE